MKTLYIDVYFLINFTVDVLSLYFAALFSKTPTNKRRLIGGAFAGAVIAVITVFMPEIFVLKILVGTLGLLIMALISVKTISLKRKIKFILSVCTTQLRKNM